MTTRSAAGCQCAYGASPESSRCRRTAPSYHDRRSELSSIGGRQRLSSYAKIRSTAHPRFEEVSDAAKRRLQRWDLPPLYCLLSIVLLSLCTINSANAQQIVPVNVSIGLAPYNILSAYSAPSAYLFGTQYSSVTAFAVAQPCFALTSNAQLINTALAGPAFYSASCAASLSNIGTSNTIPLISFVEPYFSAVRFDVLVTPSCTPQFSNPNLRFLVIQNANVSYAFRAASTACSSGSTSYATLNDARFTLSGTALSVTSNAAFSGSTTAQLKVSASTTSAASYGLLSISIQLVANSPSVPQLYQISTISNAAVGSMLLTLPASYTYRLLADAANAYLDFSVSGNQLTVARPLRCFNVQTSRKQADYLQASQFGQTVIATSQNSAVCYVTLVAVSTSRPSVVQSTEVAITVQFANLNTPQSSVTIIVPNSNGVAYVPESAPIAYNIAYINVTDDDVGLNGVVSLVVSPTSLVGQNTLPNTLGVLQGSSARTVQSSYNVSTSSLVSLQRVTASSWMLVTSQKAFATLWPSNAFSVTLVASDAGQPSLSSTVTVTLQLYPTSRYAMVTLSSTALVASVTNAMPVGSTVVPVSNALVWPNGAPSPSTSLMSPVFVYTLVAGNQLGWFAIDSSSGLITVASTPSWSSASITLTVQVAAAYPTQLSLIGNVTVQITVSPGSSVVPSFTQTSYMATVFESSPTGTQIVQVPAAVTDTSASISYSLVTGSAVFQIDQRGWISSASRFCRAAQPSYSLYVQATSSKSSQSAVALVTVSVVTMYDSVPSFLSPLTYVNLRDNLPVGYAVTRVSAAVYNAPLANVTYSIASDPLTMFSVDTSAGILRVATRFTASQFAGSSPYTVVINAAAVLLGSTPATSLVPATVYINVLQSGSLSDAQYAALSNAKSYSFTLVESDLTQPFTSVSVGSALFVPGSGAPVQFTVLNYTIMSGDPSAQFSVSSAGLVSTAKYVSSAASPVFSLRVVASLSITGSSSLFYATITVSVTVNSRSSSAPQFPSAATQFGSPTVSVPFVLPNSAAPAGAPVLVLSASENPPSSFSYSLVSSPFSCAYVDQSGVVYLAAAAFNWPAGYVTGQCSVNVSVNDSAGRVSSLAFGLQAAQYPFYAPYLPLNAYRVTLDSAASTGAVFWNAAAALSSAVTSSSVTASLSNSVSYGIAANFAGTSSVLYSQAFVNSTIAGALYVDAPLFKVLLNSDGGFNPAYQSQSQSQQSSVRNGALFSFGSSFAMQSATDNTLALRLIATSSGGAARSASANVLVVVTDSGNVYAPTFSRSVYSFSLVENSPAPALVGFVQASDADAALNGEVLYTLSPSLASSSWFTVDLVNGSVAAVVQFDREALLFGSGWSLTDDGQVQLASSYSALPSDPSSNVSVFARNGTVYVQMQALVFDRAAGSQRRSSTANVLVAILDANDNPPVFTRSQWFASVPQSAPVGTPVTRLRAVDLDQGVNAAITYSIQTANFINSTQVISNPTPFVIEPFTGIVSVAGPLTGYPSELLAGNTYLFNLTVLATDGGYPSLSSVCTLTVAVTPANQNAPQFVAASSAGGVLVNPGSVSLRDTASIGSLVCTYTATDADVGVNGLVQYAIVSGNDGAFLLDAVSGALYLVDSLSRSSYTLVISAYDQGVPSSLSVSLSTVITVTHVSTTQPPAFAYSSTLFTVLDGTASGVSLGNVSVARSTGSVSYAILTQTAYGPLGLAVAGGYFTLSSAGQLVTASTISRASVRYALIYVRATDSTSLTADQYVVVSVLPTASAPLWYVPEAVAIGSPTPVRLVAQDQPETLSSASVGAISYSVTNDPNGYFTVDSASGLVTMSPQASISALYPVAFGATRSGVASQSTTSIVFFSSNMASSSDSAYVARNYSIVVAENATIGYSLLQLQSVTPPSGASFYIIAATRTDLTNVVPAQSGLFVVNRSTGSLTTGGSLNINIANQLFGPLGLASSSPAYYVEIWMLGSAPSQLRTPVARVTIQVTNVRDSSPSFSQPFYVVPVSESAVIGQRVWLNPQPVDPDASAFTFSFAAGTSVAVLTTFQIDASSGNVSLLQPLSYASQPFYEMQLVVNDGVTSATCWLHVTVTPANLRAPVWNASQLVLSVSELAPPNSVVASLVGAATDTDAGVNGSVSYYVLSDGVASANFAIDPYTSLLYTRSWLSYEQNQFFVLTVVAVDGPVWTASSSPPSSDPVRKSSTSSVLVNILPASSNLPSFAQSSYNFSVAAAASPGSLVGYVTLANWPTLSLSADVSFGIVSSSDASLFIIEPLTGALQLLRTPNSRQASCQSTANTQACRSPVSVFQLTVAAFAAGFRGSLRGSLFASTSVVVSVTGLNLRPPVFTSSSTAVLDPYSFLTVSSPVNVWTATATDPEATSVTYSLLNSSDALAASYFTMQSNGSVFLVRSVTRQTLLARCSFSLLVQATDSGQPPLSAVQSIAFVFDDSNQYAPSFVSSGGSCQMSASVADSAAVGTAVAQLNASDADITVYPSSVRYYLVSGDQYSEWNIDRQLGTLYTSAQLDASRTPNYVLQVMALDTSLNRSLAAYCSVNVTVTNANIYAPYFPDGPYLNLSVSDSLASSYLPSPVVQVRAFDKDGNTVSYALQQTVQNTPLAINAQTGLLSLTSTATLNRLTNPALSVIIQATDNGTPPQSSSTTVTVYVTTSVVQPPVFANSTVLAQLTENNAIGASVAQVTAQLTTNNLVPCVSYSLAEMPGSTSVNAAYFGVNAQTGQITALASFNREVSTGYRFGLIATASDADGVLRRQATATIVVTIADVVEYAPVFLQGAYVAWAPSPTPAGRFLIGVSSLSLDSSSTGVPSFVLQNAPSNLFVIDSQGAISTLAQIPTGVSSYSFSVLATSAQNSALQSTVSVTINFSSSLNSVSVQLTGGSNTISVNESLAVGSTVTQVTAPSAGSLLYFSLVGGNQQESFGITSRTGVLFLKASLDYVMQPAYSLWVQCVDYTSVPSWSPTSSSAPPALGNIRVQVNVLLDPTRHPLAFLPSSFISLTYPQALPSQTVITSLGVVDPLASSSVQLSVLSPSASAFTIRQNTLVSTQQISAAANNQPAMYSVVIAATDSTTSRSASCTVQITVLSVTQSALRFSGLYAASVEELSPVGTFVTQVRAYRTYVDAPAPTVNFNGGIQYAFVTQSGSFPFTIDANTGIISVNGTLNLATASSYSLRVTATDAFVSVQTAVTVTVLDVNNNAPVFSANSFAYMVYDGTAGAYPLDTITATDADSGVNSIVSFRLIETPTRANELFTLINEQSAVGSSSVQLSTKSTTVFSYKYPCADDCTVLNTLNLLLIATDSGFPPLTSTVNISITILPVSANPIYFAFSTYSFAVPYNTQPAVVFATVAAVNTDARGQPVAARYIVPAGNASGLVDVGGETGALSITTGVSFQTSDVGSVFWLQLMAYDFSHPGTTASCTVYVQIVALSTVFAPQFVAPSPSSCAVTVNESLPTSTASSMRLLSVQAVETNGATQLTGAAIGFSAVVNSTNYLAASPNFFANLPVATSYANLLNVASNGSVWLATPLSFDSVQQLSFAIVAAETGPPVPRTATLSCSLTVLPLNVAYVPVFTQTVLFASVSSGASVGTQVADLRFAVTNANGPLRKPVQQFAMVVLPSSFAALVSLPLTQTGIFPQNVSFITSSLPFTVASNGLLTVSGSVTYPAEFAMAVSVSNSLNAASVANPSVLLVRVHVRPNWQASNTLNCSVSPPSLSLPALSPPSGTPVAVATGALQSAADTTSVFAQLQYAIGPPAFGGPLNDVVSQFTASANGAVYLSSSLSTMRYYANFSLTTYVYNMMPISSFSTNVCAAKLAVSLTGTPLAAYCAQSTYTVTLLDSAAIGSLVVQVAAFVPFGLGVNASNVGTFSFSLADQQAGPFVIGASNGQLRLVSTLNAAVRNSYTLQVVAVPSGVSQLTAASCPVLITVLSAAPSLGGSALNLSFSVNELSPPGTVIGSLQTAVGSSVSNVTQFAFVDPASAATFAQLDAGGTLTLQSTPVRPQLPTFTAPISVTTFTAGGVSQNATGLLTVYVADVDSAPPTSRSLTLRVFSVNGRTPVGSIGQVLPIDDDLYPQYLCSFLSQMIDARSAYFGLTNGCTLQLFDGLLNAVQSADLSYSASIWLNATDMQVLNAYSPFAYSIGYQIVLLDAHSLDNTVQLNLLNTDAGFFLNSVQASFEAFLNSSVLAGSAYAQFSTVSFVVIGLQQSGSTLNVLVTVTALPTTNQTVINQLPTVLALVSASTAQISSFLAQSGVQFSTVQSAACLFGTCRSPITSCTSGSVYISTVNRYTPVVYQSTSLILALPAITRIYSGQCGTPDVDPCSGSSSSTTGCTAPTNFCSASSALSAASCAANGGVCASVQNGTECLCRFGAYGAACTSFSVSVSDTSYVTAPAFASSFTIEFATMQSNALLMFQPGANNVGYLALEVRNGQPRLSVLTSAGSSVQTLGLSLGVSNSQFVSLTLGLSSGLVTLSAQLCLSGSVVCDSVVAQQSLQITGAMPNASALYVGGVPNVSTVLQVGAQVASASFIGCVRRASVNNVQIIPATSPPGYSTASTDLLSQFSAQISTGASSGSSSSWQCSQRNGQSLCSQPAYACPTGAQCVDEWTTARCICPSGLQPPTCTSVTTPFTFGGGSYVVFSPRASYQRTAALAAQSQASAGRRRKRQASSSQYGTASSVQMQLAITQSNGANSVLLYAVTASGDFAMLALANGQLLYVSSVSGSQQTASVSTASLLNSGVHTVTFQQVSAQSVLLGVDSTSQPAQFSVTVRGFLSSDVSQLVLGATGGSQSTITLQNGNVLNTPFVGCISQVQFANETQPFSGVSTQFSISSISQSGSSQSQSQVQSCPAALACGSLSCPAGQTCQPLTNASWGSFVCIAGAPSSTGLSAGAIAGIVIGAVVFVALVVLLIVLLVRRDLCRLEMFKRRKTGGQERAFCAQVDGNGEAPSQQGNAMSSNGQLNSEAVGIVNPSFVNNADERDRTKVDVLRRPPSQSPTDASVQLQSALNVNPLAGDTAIVAQTRPPLAMAGVSSQPVNGAAGKGVPAGVTAQNNGPRLAVPTAAAAQSQSPTANLPYNLQVQNNLDILSIGTANTIQEADDDDVDETDEQELEDQLGEVLRMPGGVPIEYDIDKASSIAPSDVDVSKHYHAYRAQLSKPNVSATPLNIPGSANTPRATPQSANQQTLHHVPITAASLAAPKRPVNYSGAPSPFTGPASSTASSSSHALIPIGPVGAAAQHRSQSSDSLRSSNSSTPAHNVAMLSNSARVTPTPKSMRSTPAGASVQASAARRTSRSPAHLGKSQDAPTPTQGQRTELGIPIGAGSRRTARSQSVGSSTSSSARSSISDDYSYNNESFTCSEFEYVRQPAPLFSHGANGGARFQNKQLQKAAGIPSNKRARLPSNGNTSSNRTPSPYGQSNSASPFGAPANGGAGRSFSPFNQQQRATPRTPPGISIGMATFADGAPAPNNSVSRSTTPLTARSAQTPTPAPPIHMDPNLNRLPPNVGQAHVDIDDAVNTEEYI